MNFLIKIIYFCLTVLSFTAFSLQNGLGNKPILGWSSRLFPNTTEELLKSQAEALIRTQLNSKGYSHIIIENWCDHLNSFDFGTNAIASKYFTDKSLRAISTFLHSAKLNVGIRLDHRYRGCSSFSDYSALEESDSLIFSEWELDYIHYENCFGDERRAIMKYKTFSESLNKTGRPIFLSFGKVPIELLMMKNSISNAFQVSNVGLDNWDSFVSKYRLKKLLYK